MTELLPELAQMDPLCSILGLGALAGTLGRGILGAGRLLLGGGAPAVQQGGVRAIQNVAGAAVRRIGGQQVTQVGRVGVGGVVRGGLGRAAVGGVATGGAIITGEQLLTGGSPSMMPGSDAQGYVDGMPIYTQVTPQQRFRAPKGYVVVTDPQTGQKYGMLRKVAIAAGLWKARRKPPISAAEWRELQRADRTAKKALKITQKAAMVQGKRVVSRTTRSRSSSTRRK